MSRLLALAGLLGVVAACGGGGGPVPPSLADLSGTWILTPAQGGIADDGRHVTVVQAGTSVRIRFTCQDAMPAGGGTWDGGVLAVTFDLGGGDSLVLLGGASGDDLAGNYASPGEAGTFTMSRTGILLDCAHACDPVVVPQFVATDVTDLSLLTEISLFRSSAGHPYTDGCESCRSMKHYFSPFPVERVNGNVPVYAPVDGQIVRVDAEGHGASVGQENKQVRIRSSLHPDYTFILFHVDLLPAVAAGDLVTAGQQLGTARLVYPDLAEVAHDFDIAVRVATLYGERYVSWFDVMTDALFATYVARGATARTDFVLTAAQRDADPLTCAGDAFTSTGALPAWFVLGPP